MTTYMVLKDHCTFRKYQTKKEASGQTVLDIANYSDTDAKCVFLYVQVRELVDPVEKDESILQLIIDDSYAPSYEDQVINLRDRYGNIIEAGPFQIHEIKKYQGYAGKIHHYTVVVRVLRNC